MIAKDKEKLIVNRLELREEYVKDMYKNPDNDIRGLWRTKPLASPENSQNKKFELDLRNGKKIVAKWRVSQETYDKWLEENLIVIPNNGEGMPNAKIFLNENEGQIPNSLLIDITTNEEGSKEIENLFGSNAIFDTPKPVSLIKHLLKISTKPGDIILDFFAGSGTTGQAVMELNHEEVKKQKEALKKQEANQNLLIKEEEEEQKPAGGRKFILVQLPEKINEKKEAYKAGYKKISDITIERVKRASEKYEGIDNGFKVFLSK